MLDEEVVATLRSALNPTSPRKLYIFEGSQLTDLLNGTIQMFTEYRDHHGHAEPAAAPAAVAEMIQGLDSERELAENDPAFIATSQILISVVECDDIEGECVMYTCKQCNRLIEAVDGNDNGGICPDCTQILNSEIPF